MFRKSRQEQMIFVPGHGCWCPRRKSFLNKTALYEDALPYMPRAKAELYAEMMWLMPFYMDDTLQPELQAKIYKRIMPLIIQLGYVTQFGEIVHELGSDD